MRRWALGAFLVACVGLRSNAALAQSPEDRATARQLAADADKKLAAKDFQGAYEGYAKAFGLVPAPTLKLAMGRAKIALGQLIEAQQLLYEAARSSAKPDEPAPFAAARSDADREASALMSRLAMAEIIVEGLAQGVTPRVFVDKESLKDASNDTSRAVNPGAHTFRAEAEGYTADEKPERFGEGERKKIVLKLQATGESTAPVAAAPTPPTPPPAPPAEEGTVWNGYTVGGLVGLGVFGAAGTVLGVMSSSKVSTLKSEHCTDGHCDASAKNDASTAKTFGWLSTGSFVLAGAGAAFAVYGIAKPRSSSSSPTSASLNAYVGPGSAGLSGSF